MNTPRPLGALAAFCLAACLAPGAYAADEARGGNDDSYYYYGPGRLSEEWNYNPPRAEGEDESVTAKRDRARRQRRGRDTWIHWTWGNQKVIRSATVLAGRLPVPVSIDFFRLLDSRRRGTRFRDFGLINEPNCGSSKKDEPDYDEKILKAYGLYIDRWNGDPYGYYPVSKYYRDKYGKDFPKTPEDYKDYYPEKFPGTPQEEEDFYRHYGRPSGIVGLRLFDNPAFKGKEWDVGRYFRNPGLVEPPFLVGFTCGLCHVAFDPLKPPADPEHPHWNNLAANVGNQYFREGELMFGKGRIVFGDKHPDPAVPGDPYRTAGLTEDDFLYYYAVTQQPGTSETSRISYDFINNPNTMNPIFGLKYRPRFAETTPWGKLRHDGLERVMHILKDGADSVGVEWALMRVPINIGCEGDYWVDHLFRPGREQRPFRIPEVLAGLPRQEWNAAQKSLGLPHDDATFSRMQARLAELRARYRSPYGHEEFGHDWQEAWRRVPDLAEYLMSYPPAHLPAAKAGAAADDPEAKARAEARRRAGAEVFGKACARCHSHRKAPPGLTRKQEAEWYVSAIKESPRFFEGNYLSDDERHAVTEPGLGTNMARALATNAVDHDVWAEFSSKEYKAQRSIAPLTPLVFDVPVFPADRLRWWAAPPPVRVEFDPPAGGRGYYRTPSLISLWATAPYLHNNSVGDYWVIKDGKRERFPNDGSRVGEKRDGKWVDFPIDVSVEGRLLMFRDGMGKLLNPAKRRGWVKRTAADSALLPDLAASARELVAGVAADALRHELRVWMKENQFIPAQIEQAVGAVDASLDRVLRDVLTDGEASVRLGWAAAHLRARDHADRLFELTFDDLRASLKDRLKDQPGARELPLDRLKLSLRREFLGRLDRLDKQLREASLLRVRAGTPVNLYANLGPGKLPHALLAHVRHRDDPRALAKALLEMSTCPDLVEDRGHTYGEGLTDQEKADLIEFLKTL
jgi:mono/diheme cytochrome c family protein